MPADDICSTLLDKQTPPAGLRITARCFGPDCKRCSLLNLLLARLQS